MEAIPLWKVNENEVILFLKHLILNRFGVPDFFIFYNESYFSLMKLTKFSLEKGIIIKYFANYYPRGNGVIESSNKNLIRILKKTII